MPNLTYEAYLDEVATLLTELYDLDEAVAIQIVVNAQARDYFSPHDDHPVMRTLERARQDAAALYKAGAPKPKRQARPAASPGSKPGAKPGAKPGGKPAAKSAAKPEPKPAATPAAPGPARNTKPR